MKSLSNTYCKGPAQEVSERNIIYNMARGQLHDILAKNLVAFWSFNKNLPEAILKGDEFTSLAEEISMLHNIESVEYLSLAVLYAGLQWKIAKWGRRNTKCTVWREKEN